MFFISPCAGKVTVSRYPQGLAESAVDGVIAIKDIYVPLLNALPGVIERPLGHAGARGVAWAHIDGESDAVGVPKAISVSGIADVIGVLEALENGKMKHVVFIEALACPAGCVGGPLTVENPYIARARIRVLERKAASLPPREARFEGTALNLGFETAVPARSGLRLSPDVFKAMIMLEEAEIIGESLPGLDCLASGLGFCQLLYRGRYGWSFSDVAVQQGVAILDLALEYLPDP